MLSADYPWLLALLPLPLLSYWLLPPARRAQAALRVPFFSRLARSETAPSGGTGGTVLQRALAVLIWVALVGAASAPYWRGEAITLPSSGRDLMLAVDISNSMQMEDMEAGGELVDRLTAVKLVLTDFIERRKGDRLGLILFGTNAYVQAPLTFDRQTVKRFLAEAQLGFAGPETAIGDAIGLAIKRLHERQGERHVLVLLTDGQNTAGEVKPLAAAKLAAEENLVIYTVGIGANEMIRSGPFGGILGAQRVNPSADLDEATLEKIAALTGGRYFRARDPRELMQIYALLDELEPVEDEEQTFRPRKALFHWPLGVALLASMALALWPLVAPLLATHLGPQTARPQSGTRRREVRS